MNMDFKPTLPKFDHIKRYFDQSRNSVVAKILPGEYYVTTEQEAIATVLGSCISACIWDEKRKIGGMNHFMLPLRGTDHSQARWEFHDSYSCRYGIWAMECLINELLKYGAKRESMRVKIFGGGNIIQDMNTPIGDQNIKFALEYIKKESLDMIGSDVGGPWPRKVLFYPQTGKVLVKRLQSMHNDTIQKREVQYQSAIIEPDNIQSDVELF